MQTGQIPPLARLAALILMAAGLSVHAAPAGENAGGVTPPAAGTAEKPAIPQTPPNPRDEGLRLYGQKQYLEALPYLMATDAQTDPLVQTALGNMFNLGLGVGADPEKACYWYKKAAQQGNTVAQLYTAYALEKGRGTGKNLREAIRWYTKAADGGLPAAQFRLGYLYEKGTGVRANIKQANAWYRKAAEAGHPGAQTRLGRAYNEGIGVKRDHLEAARWFLKAAEQGSALSQTALAWLYETGLGVGKD